MSETINTSNSVITTTYAPNLGYDWLNDLITKSTTNKNHSTNKNHFSGYFNTNGDSVYITKVIYSDPATIVFWSDDTKTVAKCYGEDVYSPETGLSICVLKKLFGVSSVRELFEDWVMYGNGFVTIKDVRAKHR